MKEKREVVKRRVIGIYYIVNTFVFLIFFLNYGFVTNSDIDLHYEFAQSLPLLFTNGMTWFVNNVRNAHILSYPGWHCMVLLVNCIFQIPVKLNLITCEWSYIISSALVNTMLVVFTIYLTVTGMVKCFRVEEKIAMIIGNIMIFIGPIYVPVILDKYYLGQFTPNPWHNPTTFVVKPFVIVCFFIICYVRNHNKEMEERIVNRILFVFSILLLVSALFKPSFYQGFVPAVVVYLMVDSFVLKRASKKVNIKCGISLLPVCILAAIQYSVSFTSTNNGIVFKPFEVWHWFSKNLVVSFIASFFFIFFVGALIYKNILKKEEIMISIWYLASAFSQFCLFSFKNSWTTGDFLWSVYLATYIIFLVAVKELVYYIKEYGMNIKAKFAIGALLIHLVCGVGYFIAIYRSETFFI